MTPSFAVNVMRDRLHDLCKDMSPKQYYEVLQELRADMEGNMDALKEERSINMGNNPNSRSFIDELKFAYDNPPWPHHLAICKDRYDEALNDLAKPHPHPYNSFIGEPWGLKVVVDDSVPPNEIRFVNFVRKDGKVVAEVTRIVNVGKI